LAFIHRGQRRQLEIEISSKKKIRSDIFKKRSTCFLPQGHKVALKALRELEKDLVIHPPQPHLNPLVFASRFSGLGVSQLLSLLVAA
jgi:hypothetical protein